MKAFLLVPLLCLTGCSTAVFMTYNPDGTPAARAIVSDLARNYKKLTIDTPAGDMTVEEQNETTGAAEVTRTILGVKTVDAWASVEKGDQEVSKAATAEAAKSDRARISADAAKAADIEQTKRTLGTFVPPTP